MRKMPFRTDLAVELRSKIFGEIEGVKYTEKEIDKIKISKTEILTKEGAEKIGKPTGKYLTAEFPDIIKTADFEPLKNTIKESLFYMIKRPEKVLVVGLGNSEITADSIGPATASKILATRHIAGEFAENIGLKGLKSVAVLSPNVLGKTGIESYEIVESVVKKTEPSAVLVIDALAAGSINRLFKTIQFSSSGISPGSGVKNSRKELSEKTLGVPVIGIGIPTVVEADLLAFELTEKEPPEASDMIVTPKDCDLLNHKMSEVLASALNEFLQPEIEPEILEQLV